MVGLVVVGHSRALARAAVALASEMVTGRDVPIFVAAGLDDTTFGTDAVAIMEAITDASSSGDGVVVLMDLGSAVLSTELALELLDDSVREQVLLSPAPLVEGLVAAVVSAAAGADRHEVAAEAADALAGKLSHLAPAGGPDSAPASSPAAASSPVSASPVSASPGPASVVDGDPVDSGEKLSDPGGGVALPPNRAGEAAAGVSRAEADFTVHNPHGLHARPAARLVAEARSFDATVELRNATTGSAWVAAGSLSRVATLGALAGHSVSVRASGPQAHEAVAGVVALAGRAFDEVDESASAEASPRSAAAASPALLGGRGSQADGYDNSSPLSTGGNASPSSKDRAVGYRLRGYAASPGIGIGPVRHLQTTAPEIPDLPTQGPQAERQRLDAAITAAKAEINQAKAHTTGPAAEIFDAHLLLLDDDELVGDAHQKIDDGQAAPNGWAEAVQTVAGEFERLDDAYLQARGQDVRAVGDQVLRVLLGAPATAATTDGVLVATDLAPAEAAGLDHERVAGILLAGGSPTSHGAIIARTRGIPAVVGLGAAVLKIPEGTTVALDGATGEVGDAEEFRERQRAQETAQTRARARAAEGATTRDGVTIEVGTNVGSLADARTGAEHGADMAGLVRTEFLFLDRDAAPDVDEQEATYRAIAEALGGRRVTLRTLDVGGDKPLRYLPGPVEVNPFLGVRGLRHSLAHPDLLSAQLTAMVRVARDTPVNIMFPMVSAVDEVIAARELLDAVIGSNRPDGLRVGIMMEVPAAALKAKAFAPYVDFASIGTNDLTQYTLAAERGNAALAGLADGLDPGVLRLIDSVCRGGYEVAVCGELAGDPVATPILVGLGVRELSMAPPAIPAVKEAVRALDQEVAAHLAATALTQPSAAAVRQLLEDA